MDLIGKSLCLLTLLIMTGLSDELHNDSIVLLAQFRRNIVWRPYASFISFIKIFEILLIILAVCLNVRKLE